MKISFSPAPHPHVVYRAYWNTKSDNPQSVPAGE